MYAEKYGTILYRLVQFIQMILLAGLNTKYVVRSVKEFIA